MELRSINEVPNVLGKGDESVDDIIDLSLTLSFKGGGVLVAESVEW